MNRWRDWWKQALADMRHAELSLREGHYEWACFASQQAAEKALKALLERIGARPFGHVLTRLLKAVEDSGIEVPPDLYDLTKTLDKLYITPRYPNGLVEGAPVEFFTREEAERALSFAREILRFCESHLG